MRYGVSLTTMAVAGPERSGSGFGVPVPSKTICVLSGAGLSPDWENAASDERDSIAAMTEAKMSRPAAERNAADEATRFDALFLMCALRRFARAPQPNIFHRRRPRRVDVLGLGSARRPGGAYGFRP